MQTSPILRRVVVALSLVAVSQASLFNLRADNGVAGNALSLTLGIGAGGGDSSPTATDATGSSTTSTSSNTTPTTPSTTKSTTSTTSDKTTPTSTSTSTSPTSTSSSTTSSSTTQSRSTTTVTTVIMTTDPNGNVHSTTSESTSVVTGAPQNTDSASGGMTTQTRNTVIGVVVGIGGAIILIGIGLVAWRIHRRRKAANENDGIMDYGGGYTGPEKSDAGGSAQGRTPFQSTLESYHAPTQVNQASNF